MTKIQVGQSINLADLPTPMQHMKLHHFSYITKSKLQNILYSVMRDLRLPIGQPSYLSRKVTKSAKKFTDFVMP